VHSYALFELAWALFISGQRRLALARMRKAADNGLPPALLGKMNILTTTFL
jgi:hypothetical protein